MPRPLQDPRAELAPRLLAEGRSVRFRAGGSSMEPFISDGDLVTVTPRAGRSPRIGDVVFFESPHGQLLLHRVVRVQGEKVETRGDAAVSWMEQTSVDDILGFATCSEHRGRNRRLDSSSHRFLARMWRLTGPVRRLLAGGAAKLTRRSS